MRNNKSKHMNERIENIINNVYFTRRVGKIVFYHAVFYYFYNLIFTDKRIIGEFIDKTHVSHGRLFALTYAYAALKERKIKSSNIEGANFRINLDEVLKEKVESFSLDYEDIDKIYIHKSFFKLKTSRDLPFVGKDTYFYFDKEDRQNIESIFMKILPLKTQNENIPFSIKFMAYLNHH